MQKANLKYQASIFLDAASIKPNMKDVTGLIQTLGDSTLLPFIAQENSSTRMGFRSIDETIQVRLLLLSTRFIYEKITSAPSESNIGDLETFCKDATQKLKSVLSYFGRRCHRIALVQDSVFFDIPQEELDETTTRLLKLPPIYSANLPFEWDWRCTSAMEREIGACKEKVNTITIINKRMGTIVKTESDTEENSFEEQILDSLKVTFDINTSHEDITVRFGGEEVENFFHKAPNWHNALSKEVLDFMFKEV